MPNSMSAFRSIAWSAGSRKPPILTVRTQRLMGPCATLPMIMRRYIDITVRAGGLLKRVAG